MARDETNVDGSSAGDGDEEIVIETLVFTFLEQCETSSAAPSDVLESICRENPDHAVRLRAAVESLSGTGLGLPASSIESLDRIVGGYRLRERLGAGGMGVVYRAQPEAGGADVALKLLHPQIQSEPEARDRFAREASAIERLDHPAIVRVHDHGEFVDGNVSTPFLAMALHRGVPLDQAIDALREADVTSFDGTELGVRLHEVIDPDVDPLLRSSRFRGPWWKVVAEMGADLASALAHAHENGVIHRDVKPSNVLAAPDGRVLLLDFGLAVTSDSGRLTRTGAQLGSLPYMAPEQLAGRTTDARVDVYGLGLVLYELLTMKPAFDLKAPDALAVKIARGASLRPSRAARWIPADVAASIDAVIECATDSDPDRRYSSARLLSKDLAALAAGETPSVRLVSTAARAMRRARRYPWHVATTAIVVGFLAVGGVVLSRYERRIQAVEQEDTANEIASIADRLDSLRSGSVGLALGSLSDDPRFAPSALPKMLEERERIVEIRERLDELAESGEEVTGLARRTERLLADAMIEIANAQSSMGRRREAIENYRALCAYLEERIDECTAGGEEPEPWIFGELGRSYAMLARAIHLGDPHGVPLEEARRSVEMIEEARNADPESIVVSSQRVSALVIEAEALKRTDDMPGAFDALDRAERTSVAAFGAEPTELEYRAQRGEIELRRTYYGFDARSRDQRIETLRRAVDWFEGGLEDVDGNATFAVLSLEARWRIAEEFRRDRRLDEAEEGYSEVIRRANRILAARGASVVPDDPFLRMLEKARLARGRVRVARGNAEERAEAVEEFFTDYENARVAYREQPADLAALERYVRAAGVYANQAAMHPDALPREMERALDAVEGALASSASIDESVGDLFYRRRLCHYARGLTLIRLGRLAEATEFALELEERAWDRDPVDAFSFRMVADLWAELLCVESDPAIGDELREQTLIMLEAAVDAGFDDATDLRKTEVLDPFRDDPRFLTLLERIEGS
ncbi:MAG: serine/threonine-protein kinase [Planctomycetota bacterium]